MVKKTFDSVLCFGDSDWWYHNRGHADMQFMRRFARRWPTLYVNSLGLRSPALCEGKMCLRRVLRKSCSLVRYCRDGGEGFRVLTPIYLPSSDGSAGYIFTKALALQLTSVLRMLRMRRPLVWLVCPHAAGVLDRLPSAGVVYQLSDAYTTMRGIRSDVVGQMESHVARRADVILCSSEKLLRRAQHLYGQGDYVDHGVDSDLFGRAAEQSARPRELAGVPGPVIGFFGNMDGNTVDLDLLEKVIERRPQYQFVFVGPKDAEYASLGKFPNVHLIPRQPYRRVARYGASFDVCVMPWLRNEWIAYCNPIKLKEYLALGKPVVTTPFPQLQFYKGLCYEAEGAEEFAVKVDLALDEDTPERRRERQAWASQHSWESRVADVMHRLQMKGVSCSG